MLNISIKAIDMAGLQLRFGALGERLPRAIAKGMTDTVLQAKRDVYAGMRSAIDRPTPWTMRSLFIFPAEHYDLRAAVAFKWEFGRRPRRELGMLDAPESLSQQVYGGGRKLKAAEKSLQRAHVSPAGKPYMVPAVGAKLDRYGNVTAATINRVLYGGAKGGSANLTPMSGGARKKRKGSTRYFANAKGIYAAGGRGNNPRSIVPVFIFSKQPQYHRRLDFYGITDRAQRANLDRNIDAAIDRAVNKYLR